MRIDNAEYSDGVLHLTTDAEGRRWAAAFIAGDYDIQRHRDKRSSSANRYAWALISKLAQALNVPQDEIYRRAIEDIGGKTEIVTILECGFERFRAAFTAGHIGRAVDIIGEDDVNFDCRCTYGSSDYNSTQMAQLIDNLVQDCRACGIETYDDERISALIEDWEARYDR